MADSFDAYHEWLGIAPKDQPPNYYRLLGVDLYEAKANVIDGAADRQMAHLRSFQGGQRSKICQQLLNEVSAARVLLLDRDKKAAYDGELQREPHARQVASQPRVAQAIPLSQPAAPAQQPVSAVPLEPSSSGPRISGGSSRRRSRRKKSTPWMAFGIGATVLGMVVVIAVMAMTGGGGHVALPDPSTKSKTAKSDENPSTTPGSKSDSPAPNTGKTTDTSTREKESDADAPPDERNKPPTKDPPVDDDAPVPEDIDPMESPPNDRPPNEVSRPDKAAPPDPSALAKVEAEIRGDFDVEGPGDLEAKAKLARDMLEAALESDSDPITQFAMLQIVRDLSVRHGDYAAAARTIEEMDKRFDVDAVTLRSKAMTQALLSKTPPRRRHELSREALGVVAHFHKVDRYDEAFDVMFSVLRLASKLRDPKLLDDVRKLRDRGTDLAKRFEKLRPAFETLERAPDDPDANTSVGRFYCFIKGDWDRGLAMLAKSEDAMLGDLASRERRGVDSFEEQLAVADAWWRVADKQPDNIRGEIRKHAAVWYLRALPKAKGIDRPRIHNQLDMVDAESPTKKRWRTKVVNLAFGAAITKSAQAKGNGSSQRAFDGSYTIGKKLFWYSGDKGLPAWIRVEFPRPGRVHAVRLLIPHGTVRHKNGHEPLDYEILVERRGQEEQAFQVRNGRGAANVVANPNGEGTKFVTFRFAKPIVSSWVQLLVTRTSGKNFGPIIYEMEVLGTKEITSSAGPAARPADALPFNRHWYKLFIGRHTWAEAQQLCEEMGGNLVCIESNAESRAMTDLIARAGVSVSLGGFKDPNKGWQWVSGRKMDFRNFKLLQPNNTGDVEDRLMADRYGLWYDIPGAKKIEGFICEWIR